MESALALPDGHTELLAQNVHGAVVWHFEVVDARHDRGQIIVRRVWWLAWLADDREHGREVLEAWIRVSNVEEKSDTT